MPGATLAMHKIKELVRLKFHAQLSHAQIAAALGISKGVISKYLRLIGAAGLMAAEIERLSEAEIAARLRPARGAADRPSVFVQPDYAGLHTDMKRKGMTLWLGWQEYVAAHAGARTYRYTQFVDRYHQFAKSLKRSMRQVHRAGEKCFIDYAGPTVGYGDGQRAQIFVAVLGASSYTFACATARQTLADWVAGLVRAFEFFGGVTELTVPDNARRSLLIRIAMNHRPAARCSMWRRTTTRRSCRRARTSRRTMPMRSDSFVLSKMNVPAE